MFKKINDRLDKLMDKYTWAPLAAALTLGGTIFGVLPAIGLDLAPPDTMDTAFAMKTKDGKETSATVHLMYYGDKTCAMQAISAATNAVSAKYAFDEIKAKSKDEYLALRKEVRAYLDEKYQPAADCGKRDYVFSPNFYYTFNS
jgi:hypothetical protein